MLNVKLLREVQEMILKYPENLDMSSYVCGGLLQVSGDSAPRCGTTACIAGWAVAIHDGFVSDVDNADIIGSRAEEILGIEEYRASELFCTDEWSREFRVNYPNIRFDFFSPMPSEVAAAYIDYYIAKYAPEEPAPCQ